MFDSRQLPLPLNPGLSHSSVCTPTHRISHHHKHHTWFLLYYLTHLPSNTQGQTRRLLPHVSLKQNTKSSCTSETRDPQPYGQGLRFLFHSDLARMMLTLHRDLHHAHADTNMSKRHLRRYRRFFLFSVLALSRYSKMNWKQMQARKRGTKQS